MEKKKISTKTIVIIVICIVLLLTLIGGGVYWYIFVLNADKNSPEEVLTQYVSYINEKDFESMYSAFANEGNMIKPYIEYKENATAEYWIKNAFTKEAAKTVRDDMIQTIENANGTGHEAKINGMTLAGKTGTAEIKASQDDDSGTEIGWFNAFKVSDNPNDQLLIVNMIEDVKDRGGSHYLLPKVKAMFE